MYKKDENGVLIPNLPFPRTCFKKEEGGHTLTQRLILEFGYFEEAIYTIKDEDYIYEGKLYPSLKRLYLEECDFVEYDFASKYFLNYPLWERLCKNKMFKPHIKVWREELELKLRSIGLANIIEIAKTPKGFSAARFLVEKGFNPNKRGRPSKEAIEKEARQQASLNSTYNDDLEAIRDLIGD